MIFGASFFPVRYLTLIGKPGSDGCLEQSPNEVLRQTKRERIIMQSKTKSTYTVVRHGRSFGPYSASQLRQFASAKHLLLDDLVCRVGTHLRTRVRKIDGLSFLLNESQGATSENPALDNNVKVKPVSALLTAVRSYRQWHACRRALADRSNYG